MQTPVPALQRTLPWRVLLIVLLGAVSALALTPPPTAPPLNLGWDKLHHVLAFASLALCAVLGWRTPRRLPLGLLAALLAFGGLIELLQQHVPNRTAEWGDLGADAIGIAAGVLLAHAVLRFRGETVRPGR